MRPDLPELLPLICPACRTRTERGREMHTVHLAAVHLEAEDGEVLEGALQCDNPPCARRYPIIDGVPLLLPELPAFLRTELAAVVEADLHPETAALLCAAGPDEEPYPRLLEHLSIYLDTHWGDRAEPPPSGPLSGLGMAALCERLRARQEARVPCAVELGCSVGRGLAELAPGADLLVGVDLHFGALRRARRLLKGQPLRYARRVIGRSYKAATVKAGALARPGVALVCGDALDPPLCPGTFQRVVALGLLDSVRWPPGLLSVVDGLCQPGGELVLASPYSWQSHVVDEAGRIGGADPAGALAGMLTRGEGLEGAYALEEQADLPWHLRRDDRSAQVYLTHYLRARKQPPPA